MFSFSWHSQHATCSIAATAVCKRCTFEVQHVINQAGNNPGTKTSGWRTLRRPTKRFGLLLYPFAKLADWISGWWQQRGAKAAQEDLDRVKKELGKDEFDQAMCPICLELLGPGFA